MSQADPSLEREFHDLEGRRSTPGLTPLEYLRWSELKKQLGAAGSDASSPGSSRILIEFASYQALADAWASAMADGGVFIHTPFTLRVGTEFTAVVLVKESGEHFEVPASVASHNLDQGFSTRALGMGVRFKPRSGADKAHLAAIRNAAGVGAA